MSTLGLPAVKTATVTFDISDAELAGANTGQRPDLLARTQAIYRTPNGNLYSSNGDQLVPLQSPIARFKTDALGAVLGLLGPKGEDIALGGASVAGAVFQYDLDVSAAGVVTYTPTTPAPAGAKVVMMTLVSNDLNIGTNDGVGEGLLVVADTAGSTTLGVAGNAASLLIGAVGSANADAINTTFAGYVTLSWNPVAARPQLDNSVATGAMWSCVVQGVVLS